MIDCLRQEFSVRYRHEVHFVEDMLRPSHDLLARVLRRDGGRGRLLAVFDAGVWHSNREVGESLAVYCETWQVELADMLVVPGGETAKNSRDAVECIARAIDAQGICRHSAVLAVGGGAVLDAVGFAAAIAHRGVRLVRAPTTVLAQADAGIGIKNGINAYGKKNYLGTFDVPAAVINDCRFLLTLPMRDWRAGMAEAVKVALIRDADFFNRIETHAAALACRDMTAMRALVRRSAELHLRHIGQGGDPFEQGSARPLDFGHWAAHRLEMLSHNRLRHGEAVAIGIALDSLYAMQQGLFPSAAAERVLGLLEALGFWLYVPELEGALFEGIRHFREHLGGRLCVTMPIAVGSSLELHALEEEGYRSAIHLLKRRHETLRAPLAGTA